MSKEIKIISKLEDFDIDIESLEMCGNGYAGNGFSGNGISGNGIEGNGFHANGFSFNDSLGFDIDIESLINDENAVK